MMDTGTKTPGYGKEYVTEHGARYSIWFSQKDVAELERSLSVANAALAKGLEGGKDWVRIEVYAAAVHEADKLRLRVDALSQPSAAGPVTFKVYGEHLLDRPPQTNPITDRLDAIIAKMNELIGKGR